MNAKTRHVRITVNNQEYSRSIEPRTLLSDFLRHDIGLTGTHVGCEHGICGACTVVVNGAAARSCLMLAVQADGAEIRTVESVGAPDALDPIQESFRQEHGLQCGFCTPGIVMSLVAARDEGVGIEEVERQVLAGHICRCTGYVAIRAAARAAWSAAQAESVSREAGSP